MEDKHYQEMELAYAIIEGYAEDVSHMLDASLALNLTYSVLDGGTLLHAAAKKGASSLVRQLLAYGADPSIHDQHTRQALPYAAEAGCVETVCSLLQYQKHVDGCDAIKRAALYYAI